MSSKPGRAVLLDCGAAMGNTCGMDRTGPMLCGVQCCEASHSTDNSQCRLLKMADHLELSDSKMARQIDFLTCLRTEKSSRKYTSFYKSSRIQTFMYLTTWMTAIVTGKSHDGKCEVVGQVSFALLNGCH